MCKLHFTSCLFFVKNYIFQIRINNLQSCIVSKSKVKVMNNDSQDRRGYASINKWYNKFVMGTFDNWTLNITTVCLSFKKWKYMDQILNVEFIFLIWSRKNKKIIILYNVSDPSISLSCNKFKEGFFTLIMQTLKDEWKFCKLPLMEYELFTILKIIKVGH